MKLPHPDNRTPVALAVAATLALSASGLAYAADELAEVVVTGSRIALAPGMTTATPVTALNGEELKVLSPSNLIDSLTTLPQFSGNSSQDNALGGQNSGGSNVNLRGAGANRTLTLLDGRRVVSTNRFGAVDVNSLPDMLIKNVENVTGGASASYGTDAVAGVVNFILDTNFEGVKVKAQTGQTTRSDGENREYGLALGHAFGDRLHFIASAQYADYDGIKDRASLRSRPWFKQSGLVSGPNNATGPTFLRTDYVQPTNFATTGLIVDNAAPALNRLLFNSTGTAVSQLPFYGLGNQNSGCQCQGLPYQDYGVNIDDEIKNGFRRSTAFARLGFDLNDNTEIFGQALWADNAANTRRESIALLSIWQGRIYSNNAFLTPALQTRIFNGAPASRITTDNTTGAPQQVNYAGFALYLPDDASNPIGETRQVTANEMKTFTVGFKTKFGDTWKMDGFVQRGENRQDFLTYNGIRVDRLWFAIDAVQDANGNVVCRAALPQYDPNGYLRGCAPINLFGGAGTITPEAAAWIRDDVKDAAQWIKQTVAEVSANGDLGFGLPAGSISAAFGLSYRKDTLDQRTVDPADEFPALPDGRLFSDLGLAPASLRGLVPQGQSGGIAGYTGFPGLRFVGSGYLGDANSSSVQFSSLRAISGSSDVKEGFGEFFVPLVKDVPVLQEVNATLAARWADYSGSGNIWAWKAGLDWTIVDDVRFRATRSRDVRAPNLRERFDQTRGGFTVTDFAQTPPQTVSGATFSGGNEAVNPEEADTTVFGVVLQPSFLSGFQTSVDWYQIKIHDAISQLTAQQLVNACVGGDQVLCQYVIRSGNPVNGPIQRIDSLFINLAEQKIEGLDVEMAYTRGIELFGGGAEKLSVRLFGTRLFHNSTQNRGQAIDEQVGQISGPLLLPKDKATALLSYSNGAYSATVIGRYIGDGILDRRFVQSPVAIAGRTTIDDNHVASVVYADLTLGWQPEQYEGLRIYASVTNLLDHAPPQTPQQIGRTGMLELSPLIHDVVGRRWVAGVEYKF